MDIFILTFREGAWPDAFQTDLGAFSTEEGAMAAAEQDAECPLPWEKYSDNHLHALCSSDEKGPFYFTKRMRLQ